MSLDRNELHAWVDGRLDGERLRRFERQLEADSGQLEEAQAWRRQAEALRALGRTMLAEPVPSRFAETVRSHGFAAGAHDASPQQAQAAGTTETAAETGAGRGRSPDPGRWLAAAAIAALAWSVGWLMHAYREPAPSHLVRSEPPPFVRDAVAAHAVYTPEVRHPVEVAAAQHQHLVQWLSKRLGTALTVPSLDAAGWSLVGGRLLPGIDGARAQFMYQDASGARLTLYVADAGESSRDTAFRFERVGPVAAFYWVDGHFGYALSGHADRSTLLGLAEEVYRQLSRAQPRSDPRN